MIVFLIFILVFIVWKEFANKKRLKQRQEEREQWMQRMQQFYRGYDEISVEEFRKMKSSANEDITGVYVLHNITKDMYYVGQGKKAFQRLNAHLTGSGNGDVYADYKYGDEFKIMIIPLSSSGYSNLDKLEKDTITAYDAFRKGYNKNGGNRSV